MISRGDFLAGMFPVFLIFFGIYGICAYVFDFSVPLILWIPMGIGIIVVCVLILLGILLFITKILDFILDGKTFD